MSQIISVALVDDDVSVLRGLSRLLEAAGYNVQAFSSPIDFLNRPDGPEPACLILDMTMPAMTGLELQEQVRQRMGTLPIVFLSATAHVADSVRALRKGAFDFLTKPVAAQDLLTAVSHAVQQHQALVDQQNRKETLSVLFETLTPREREVGILVTRGLLNKQIAADLNISEATVKIHRGRVMEKLNVNSVPDLVRFMETLGVPVPVQEIGKAAS